MKSQNNTNIENSKKMSLKKIIFHTPSKYITITILTLIIGIYSIYLNGFKYVKSYMDAFFITGLLWICIGILSAIAQDGFFRIFSYSGYYIVNKFKQKPLKNYRDYSENKEKDKDLHKWTFTPYVFCGCILFVISLIFLIIISIIS